METIQSNNIINDILNQLNIQEINMKGYFSRTTLPRVLLNLKLPA